MPPRPGPGCEVGIAFRGRRACHGPRDTHLPVQIVPVHHGGGTRRCRQLRALLRLVIGIEHEVSRLCDEALAQDHACRGRAVGRSGSEHHGVRIGLLMSFPGGMRHGSFVHISEDEYSTLKDYYFHVTNGLEK